MDVPGELDAGGLGEVPQAADGRGRQWDQDDPGALAAHAQDPVAVLLAEVGDVRAGGFEDLQAEQSVLRYPGR